MRYCLVRFGINSAVIKGTVRLGSVMSGIVMLGMDLVVISGGVKLCAVRYCFAIF